MSVSLDEIKKLKELTGVGLTDAKKALVEAGGDFDKALEAMRKKGLTKAEKRGEREAREGLIESYVHGNRIGVIVELNCETDFVARTDNFKSLAHELAMQIAAMRPKWVSQDDIPEAERTRKREELVASAKADPKNANKPAEILDKIIDGQLNKYFSELVLLDQTYWKDDSKTIGTLVKEEMAKLGENIVVRRFARLELGVSED
ncbi:translation elongation factor Ts [Candidatus Saccharibacteria bacterium]|jgi:translation elongation factor Ts|nr:translation elongation factor Ts [Candidatus Saccharibacteria bacterium]MCG5079342.1 translation elongation factor Ts [Candidatus Saccharibacteria bacterium]